MFYTDFQREAMRFVGLAKVHYKNMWKKNQALGYVTPGSPYDNIYIAKDVDDDKIKKIALLHECGHIKYNHTSVNMREEFKYVKSLFKKLNRPYSLISVYGGPMGFCNIAMDLEVNSKLLTLANTRYMEQAKLELCTPESFDLEVMESYRDYYIPLIEKIPEEDDEMKEFEEKIKKLLEDLIKDISPNQKGKSSAGQSGKDSSQEDEKKSGKGKGKSGESEDADSGDGGSDSGEDKKDKKSGSGGDKENSDGDSDSGEDSDEDDYNDDYKYAGDEADDDESDDEEDGNVNEVIREDENSDDSANDSESNRSMGKGYVKNGSLEVKDNCSAVIKNFLQKIVGSSMVYLPDSLKHYNRGSRDNSDGFLYNSIRKRNRTDKKRFGICIDISGSMNTESILTALGSLKSSLSVLDNNSVVVTWNEYLCEEFPITKVPKKVSKGGGTSMHRGLQYLVDKGCDNIVMYSDFETDIESMTSILKKSHVNMYSIVVSDGKSNKNSFYPYWGGSQEDWKKFIKRNKDWLLVK